MRPYKMAQRLPWYDTLQTKTRRAGQIDLARPPFVSYAQQRQLQVILKILRNLGNQMRSVGASYIVAVAGIDEVV